MDFGLIQIQMKMRGAKEVIAENQAVASSMKATSGAAASSNAAMAGSAASSGAYAARLATVRKWALLSAGAIGIGLVAAAKSSVSAYMESEEVWKGVESAIRSSGKAANVTSDDLQELALKMQNYSGISDEEIGMSGERLLTFKMIRNEQGKGNKVFDRTLKLSADLSKRFGTTMPQATMQLAKAINDPITGLTMLRRVGVSFNEQQTEQIQKMWESGRTMKAQKKILDIVAGQGIGGAARAYGNTLPGALDKARESFGNLQELIGEKIAPAVKWLAEGLTRITDLLQQGNTPTVLITVALGAFATALMVAAGAQIALNTAMMLNPIGLIVAGVVALAAAFVVAYHKVDWFRKAVDAVWAWMKASVESAVRSTVLAWNWLKGAVASVGRAIKAAIRGVVAAFNWIKRAVANVIAFVREHWKLIVALLTGPIGAATMFILAHWDKIKAAASSVVGFVKDRFNAFVDFFRSLPSRIAGAAAGLFNGIKDAFRSAINYIIDKWNNLELRILPGSIDLPGPAPTIHIPEVTLKTPDVPHLAKGGTVRRAGATIVGERGPELLSLPVGAQVAPLAGSEGRGLTRIYLDSRVLAEAVNGAEAKALARA